MYLKYSCGSDRNTFFRKKPFPPLDIQPHTNLLHLVVRVESAKDTSRGIDFVSDVTYIC